MTSLSSKNAATTAPLQGQESQPRDHNASSLKYRRDVDGLRAIAVASVVLFHVFPNWLPGGFVGVDIFFVISGFLISRIIWDGLTEGQFSYLDFYRRRIMRIFPALALVLAATLVAGWALLFWDEFARLGKHTLAGAFFFSNFSLWNEGGYFDIAVERKPLLHLWSLSIEEQFYLVWPLILVAWWRLRLPFSWIAVPLGLASFALSVWLTAGEPTAAFYNPLSRFWELLLGAVVGNIVRRGFSLQGPFADLLSTLSVAALVATFITFSRSTPFPGAYALLPAGATAILLLCSPNSGLNSLILSRRLMVGVGLISYPLYLWHWPIFSLAFIKLQGFVFPGVGAAIVGASVILAWCTYSFVEKPLRHRRGGWLTPLMLVATVFGLGGVGYVVEVNNGFVSGTAVDKAAPYLTQPVSLQDWLQEVRSGSCHIQDWETGTHASSCVEQQRPLVWLWGDSHAAALFPGFRDLHSKFSFGFAQTTQAGCPPLPGAVSNVRKNCAEINERVRGEILAAKPDVVILSAAWISANYVVPRTNQELISGLKGQLEALRAGLPNTRIIVVGPIPRWEPELSKILYEHVERTGSAPPRYLALPDTESNRNLRAASAEMRNVTESLGGTFVSPQDYFCEDAQASRCLTRLDDSPRGLVVFDDGHLNSPAAIYFVSKLAEVLFR